MAKRSCTVLLLVLIGLAARAQENIYVGAAIGNLDYSEDNTDALLGRVSDTVSAWKVLGGFEFSKYVALEVAYGKSDDLMQSGAGNVFPYGDVSLDLYADFATTSLTAIGQVPFDWGVLLGGLGYFRTEADFLEVAEIECCGTQSSAFSATDDGLSAKLGVEWRFGRFGTRYGIRLEYDWYDLDAVDFSSVSLGATYGF